MIEPAYVTLEPNKHNQDAVATTLYFKGQPTADEVMEFIVALSGENTGHGIDPSNPVYNFGVVWVDCEDPHFSVEITECPFEGHTRWQAHPTV